MKFEFYLVIFDNGYQKHKKVYTSLGRALEGIKYKFGNNHTKLYGINASVKTELNDFGYPKKAIEDYEQQEGKQHAK